MLRPHVRGQPGVVGQRIQTLVPQPVRRGLDAAPGQAVDDAGLALMALQEAGELALRVGLAFDGIADVRPVESGDEAHRFRQRQTLDDVFAGPRVGGGRQRHPGDTGEMAAELIQGQVVLTEVVAPRRNAVGLVDGDDGHRDAGQQVQGGRLQQALRGDVQQVQGAGLDGGRHFRALGGGLGGVEIGRSHAELAQRRHLIGHERDQRRHHDADTVAQHRRNLVAQRLAAAGGHQHEAVPPRHHRVDDLGLTPAECRIAVNALEHCQGGLGHRIRIIAGKRPHSVPDPPVRRVAGPPRAARAAGLPGLRPPASLSLAPPRWHTPFNDTREKRT